MTTEETPQADQKPVSACCGAEKGELRSGKMYFPCCSQCKGTWSQKLLPPTDGWQCGKCDQELNGLPVTLTKHSRHCSKRDAPMPSLNMKTKNNPQAEVRHCSYCSDHDACDGVGVEAWYRRCRTVESERDAFALENEELKAQNKAMKEWIIKNCTEKACKKDRDPDCWSCLALDFLDSLPSL